MRFIRKNRGSRIQFLSSKQQPAQVTRFQYFRIHAYEKKCFTVEPCLQRIENRQLAPNTPGGVGEGACVPVKL
jgi:hypothetical protein